MKQIWLISPAQASTSLQAEIQHTVQTLNTHGYKVKNIDSADRRMLSLMLAQAASQPPFLLITFDMAGFDINTIGEEPFYNNIPCTMLHYLEQPLEKYEKILKGRLNFTMEFCVKSKHSAKTLEQIGLPVHLVNYFSNQILSLIEEIDIR